jgi:putative PIN family toxin of toxin-antitoxin system
MSKPRVVLDTNILISYMLKPSAGIAHVVHTALDSGVVLFSQDTFDELRNIIERFVKRGYVTAQEASEFLGSIVEVTEWVKILETIQACRDPKDDKFLELAVNGQAEYLITGDKDLLVLHPFRETKILSTKDFIDILLT